MQNFFNKWIWKGTHGHTPFPHPTVCKHRYKYERDFCNVKSLENVNSNDISYFLVKKKVIVLSGTFRDVGFVKQALLLPLLTVAKASIHPIQQNFCRHACVFCGRAFVHANCYCDPREETGRHQLASTKMMMPTGQIRHMHLLVEVGPRLRREWRREREWERCCSKKLRDDWKKKEWWRGGGTAGGNCEGKTCTL